MAIDLEVIKDTKLYDTKEVAKLVNRSVHTVRGWIWRKRLKARLIGGSHHVLGKDLKQFLLNGCPIETVEESYEDEHQK